MRRSLDREDGWVLVSAIVLMAIMLSVGLSSYAFVDTGQKRSRESRERESSLGLAEAALYAQGFALTRYWPNPSKQLGGDCSSSAALTGTTLYCPDRDTLAKGSSANGAVAQFTTTDFGANATWTTSVRDNYGALKASYSEALVSVGGVPTKLSDTKLTENGVDCPQTPCRMDFNGDNQLWVQAKATVRGKSRGIVARLKLEKLRESVPQAGVVAGALQVSNNGNKLMVDGTGSTIVVRCANLSDTNCMDYQANKGQLTPTPSSTPGQPNFMTPSQLKRFKARAQTDGTYFAGCPTNAAQLTGAVVWVESCTTSYASIGPYSSPCVVPASMSSNCINSTDKPGMLIWHCGTIRFTASSTYYGIMYVVNNSDGTCASFTPKSGCSDPVYDSNGGSGVLGALVVDGTGCVTIGSNSLNMKFDANVFSGVTSYGTVGLVQNTWRELKAGS
jgi:Tfp pilus assembly protein PilX